MDTAELAAVIESLIFAAEKPLRLGQISELMEVDRNSVQAALNVLDEKYNRLPGGIQLAEVAEGFQFRTRPEYAFWVRRAQKRRMFRLSRAALEILAIVAYRQPITRGEMEQIRGVDCDGALRTLLEKKMVRLCGKKEAPGRPLLYGTSSFFLETFGLRDLKELPDLRQIQQLFPEGKGPRVDE
ncbi:MAG: SMC-Scp complex subunit ScpB [Deltaproteobacteria bacterium]|nr:SMC-Scp complex subunit ScpB [Deltaproteobacteria bacterium]